MNCIRALQTFTDFIVSFHASIIKLHFVFFRPGRKIGELHVVLGLEDLGPVNLQRLMGANEVSWKDGRVIIQCRALNLSKRAIGETCLSD